MRRGQVPCLPGHPRLLAAQAARDSTTGADVPDGPQGARLRGQLDGTRPSAKRVEAISIHARKPATELEVEAALEAVLEELALGTALDRSGLGLPVIRMTYDLQPNEHRVAEYMEARAEDILRKMGATKTWRGQRFGGVVSSHELGGCRMGDDPTSSVVDADLQVHDTPGLYVFGTATFPTCHGVNPTLTMFAVCQRAAERLADRFKRGEHS